MVKSARREDEGIESVVGFYTQRSVPESFSMAITAKLTVPVNSFG
jgi:hypothetical protein